MTGSRPTRWQGAATLAAIVLWLQTALFTVDARQVAVVTAFGAPVRSLTEPGLHAKAPWPIQDVVRFDHRARILSVPATEVLTKDKKNLVVEPFCVWRVEDPQKFLETVLTDEAAEVRLKDLVASQIAGALGQVEFTDLFSTERESGSMLGATVVKRIQDMAFERLGVTILDVQLEHVGLPVQNEQSIYERMRAERSRIASATRSEGAQRATEIRAQADRAAAEILANAIKEAALVTAEAEGRSAEVLGAAYAEDPALFHLLTAIDTMKTVLGGQTVLVLDADDDPILREVMRP
jgi:modulator of FtsH protease HflC